MTSLSHLAAASRKLRDELEDLEEQLDALAASPGKDELLGIAEVADLIEIDRRLISIWLFRGQLPEPYVRLKAGPVWTRRQIDEWNERRIRKEAQKAKAKAKKGEAPPSK